MRTDLADTAVEYLTKEGYLLVGGSLPTEQLEGLEKKLRETAKEVICDDCDDRMPDEPPYDDSHD